MVIAYSVVWTYVSPSKIPHFSGVNLYSIYDAVAFVPGILSCVIFLLVDDDTVLPMERVVWVVRVGDVHADGVSLALPLHFDWTSRSATIRIRLRCEPSI